MDCNRRLAKAEAFFRGEGQRVRLGRALLSDSSRSALLDEPFRGLDRLQRRALLGSTRNWWKGTTLLCVSHDIAETLDFIVLVIDDGRIVEDGKPIELAQAQSQYRDLLHAESCSHADNAGVPRHGVAGPFQMDR